MRWDRNDIRYIRQDLRKRGLAHGVLLDELLDHVCCEVENEMKQGLPFKKAYEKVLMQVSGREVMELQEESFWAKNYNTQMMLRNTFKMMWRNALKYRLHTFISLAGLAIGLTCFILIAVFVKHELSYDTQFSKAESIYRVTMSSTVGGLTNTIPTSYAPIGPELKARYGDVAEYTRLINYKYTRQQPTFRSGDKVFYEDGVIFADSTFFTVFDFPFAAGDAATALNEPNAVVLTQKMAQKYFGEKNALGKALRFNNTEMTVTGVLENIPSNTHLQFDFVIPMTGLAYSGVFGSGSGVLESYQVDWFWDYLYIPNAGEVAKIEQGINSLVAEKTPDTYKEYNLKFYLQAMEDVHLHSNFDYNTDLSQNGNSKNLFILVSIGFLVLLISSINFINISMAAATRRYKEVGISKVLGAMRSQLRLHYLLEAVVMSLAALLIALAAAGLLLPLFSELEGVNMTLSLQRDGLLLAGILVFTVVIGIVSGAYPAFFVSSFEAQRVLKGVWKPGVGGAAFRKVLIGVQITISIFLIIGAIVVSEQLGYINSRSLGFDKEHVIMLPIRGTKISGGGFVSFKNELLNESSIASVSSVSEPIGREVQFMSFKIEGKEADQFVKILNVTHDFVKTMNLEMVEGRDFSPELASDSVSGFVINEAAAKAFGWDNPIGKGIQHSWRAGVDGRVIGVVKDFNFEPLQKQIDPIIMWFGRPFWYAAVKVEPGRNAEALAALEKTWKQFEPEKPFAFQFLDASIQHVYEKEQRMSQLFFIFTVVSIATAMLGLYGLITFILEQRLMEIGVRKVMGASIKNILSLIGKDYLILVLLSFVVAVPLTYWIMNQWLQGFAFRVGWSVWYFGIGLLTALVVVLTTVLSKALSAASVNPARVLRGE